MGAKSLKYSLKRVLTELIRGGFELYLNKGTAFCLIALAFIPFVFSADADYNGQNSMSTGIQISGEIRQNQSGDQQGGVFGSAEVRMVTNTLSQIGNVADNSIRVGQLPSAVEVGPTPEGRKPDMVSGNSVNKPSKAIYNPNEPSAQVGDPKVQENSATAGPVPFMMWKAWVLPQNAGKEFDGCNDEECVDQLLEKNAGGRASIPASAPKNAETETGWENATINQISEGNAEITSDGVVATTKEKLGSDGKSLLISGTQIKITPSAAAQNAMKAIETQTLGAVSIEGEKRPVYKVETKKAGRLIWILPVELEVKAKVDVQTGQVIEIEKPWWSFLVG